MKKKRQKTHVLSNNWYMLRQVAKYSPGYLWMQLGEYLVGGLVEAVTAVYTKMLFDALDSRKSVTQTMWIVIMMIIFLIFTYLYYTSFRYYFQTFQRRALQYRMQSDLIGRAVKLDVACYDDPVFYNDYVMAMEQANTRAEELVKDVGSILKFLISGISVIGVLLTVDIGITVVVLIGNVARVIFSLVINRLRIKEYEKLQPETRKTEYVRRVHYLVDAAKELRISRVGENLKQEYDDAIENLVDLRTKYGKYYSFLTAGSTLTGEILFGGVLVWLLYLLLVQKTILLGGFTVVINSMWRISWYMRALMNSLVRMHEHALFIDKYLKFLAYEPQITGSQTQIPSFERLQLQDVDFAYAKDPVLQQVNLEISRGEKIAIVGYNGAGKTTLIKLLMRLYDVSQGQILWNGQNIRQFDPEVYRRRIGVVFQDYHIFATTVAENVLGADYRGSEDDATVLKALQKATFSGKLKTFQNGLNTLLTKEFDDNGENLSGGESQKVAIVRVFARPYDLIIMDEPSSALDPVAEYELNKSIAAYAEEQTVIFISHRLSTTRIADRIYMFSGGRIIESGSHEQLLAQNGEYAKMFRMQAEKYTQQAAVN